MNKQKKMRLFLSSLKQKQLLSFFQTFLQTIQSKFYKSIKQISFSCFQSTCQIDNIMVNGYGKTSSQSLISGINNIIDSLIQDDGYAEVMRQCLKKINITTIINNNHNNNQTNHNHNINHKQNNITHQSSKKQLLSTQKAMKTLGPEPSSSFVEKKILTMSANLSSSSKDSSSKAKSIKDEIFEYFNLQNLKVKNPNHQQQQHQNINVNANHMMSSLINNNNNHKNSKSSLMMLPMGNLVHSKSKEKYLILREKEQKSKVNVTGANNTQQNQQNQQNQNQLELVYRRIKEIQEKISQAEKDNQTLKLQILNKKKKTFNNHEIKKNQQNYFTRPSADNNKKPPHVLIPASQSSKKISYIQMSTQKQPQTYQKPNTKKYETKHSYLLENQQNQFDKIQLINNFNTIHTKDCVSAKLSLDVGHKKQRASVMMMNNSQQASGYVTNNSNNTLEQQKRCLVDISNLAHNNVFVKSEFNTTTNNNDNQSNNESKSINNRFMTTSISQNVKTPSHNNNNNSSIFHSKAFNNESEKKLRSFSVNNHLVQKLSTFTKNPVVAAGTSTIIPANLNSSFDTSIPLTASVSYQQQQQQKKIKIPKLNLQILPNYHGKSNKSLNQSLMQNYEKKNQVNQMAQVGKAE